MARFHVHDLQYTHSVCQYVNCGPRVCCTFSSAADLSLLNLMIMMMMMMMTMMMIGWLNWSGLPFLLVFSPILAKPNWKIWSTCQHAQNCGTDFQNCDFKIFGEFFKIFTSEAELPRPTGLISCLTVTLLCLKCQTVCIGLPSISNSQPTAARCSGVWTIVESLASKTE